MGKYTVNVLAALLMLFGLGWYADSVAHNEIAWLLRVIPYVLAGGLALGVLIAVGFAGLAGYDWWMSRRAQRIGKERDNRLISTQDGTWLISHPEWEIVPLHKNPYLRINGHERELTQAEYQYMVVNALRVVEGVVQQPMILPAPELPIPQLPESFDLLDYIPQQPRLNNIFLGLREKDGQIVRVTAPIWQLVHIANAGATDSGKSNMERVLAYQVSLCPNVETIFVDLKRQTFKPFWDSQKNLYPIIKDTQDFITVLGELRGEIERRLSLFEQYRTLETIHDYNRTVDEPLSYIVMFLDEVSNLFNDKQAHSSFEEIIRIARAAGVYIVAAGQTWSHRTLSPDTRSQFRTAFHFATTDKYSSRMLLNNNRATEIEIQGRAMASLPFGMAKDVIEIQTPYLDLQTVVDTLPQGGSARKLPGAGRGTEEAAEELFVRLVEKGGSRSEASMAAFGKPYAGRHVSYCRGLLGEV